MTDQERYEAIAVIKPKDAIKAIASSIYTTVKLDWIDNVDVQKNASTEERIWGAVNSTLELLQYGSHELPPFNLVAAAPTHFPNPIFPVNDHPDYLMRRFEVGQVVPLMERTGAVPSISTAFADEYEHYRKRFQAAARDLFGQTYDARNRPDPNKLSDVE